MPVSASTLIKRGQGLLLTGSKQQLRGLDSADTLCDKNFVEIALSCTVTEINASLRLTQKFKMAAESGGKTIFAKSRQ